MRKRISYWTLLATILLQAGMVIQCSKKESTTGKYMAVTQFDPNRDAARDIEEAIAEAQRTGKRIILDVGGDWCIWCHKLDQFFEENDDIHRYMQKHFIIVKINYSKENRNEEVLSRYPKIPGYPHLFVLDSDGKLLHSQDTGQLESGDYHDRDKVFSFLKAWAKS